MNPTAIAVPKFGRPAINYDGAIDQLIQSNIGPYRTLAEYTIENAPDAGATRIDVEIKGIRSGDNITVHDVIVQDNGIGMSHLVFAQLFRGFCGHNPDVHMDANKKGKNDLGAKAGLDYFTIIDVTTTTAEPIPEYPDYNPEDEPVFREIKDIQNYYSKLKPGDDDTEIRRYRMKRRETEILQPWETVDAAEHFTTIHLHTPINGRAMILNINTLHATLASNFRWLHDQIEWNELNGMKKAKRKKRGMFLKLPDTNWEEIMPFDNGWNSSQYTPDNHCGSYLLVSGSMLTGCSVFYTSDKNSSPEEKSKIPPIGLNPKERELFLNGGGDVKIWLQLCYGMRSEDKTMLISISGSIIRLPYELLNKIKHGGGVSTSIRGVISSNNAYFKTKLRHNRTELDSGDRLVSRFWDYIYNQVFATMANYYADFTQETNNSASDSLIDEALEGLSSLFSESREPGTHKLSHWICLACGHKFTHDINSKPRNCPTCESTEIAVDRGTEKSSEERTNRKGPKYIKVKTLGHFIPMLYNEHDKRFEIVEDHPEFIHDKSNWNPIYKDRITHNALIAISALKLNEADAANPERVKKGDLFLQNYGSALKKHFLKDDKRKKAIERVWREKEERGGLRLWADKETSSFE
jgi:predicted Zn-ribbon and HTH transcriptional regulator